MGYSCIQTGLDWTGLDWIGFTELDRFGRDITDGLEATWKTNGCVYQTSARRSTLYACHRTKSFSLLDKKQCDFECGSIQIQFNKRDILISQVPTTCNLTRFVAVEVTHGAFFHAFV